MKPVSIIGIGLSPEDLTPKHQKLIDEAEILVGGRRLLDCFEESPAEKIVITRDLKTLMERIEKEAKLKSVVILASGDPLFFGIGQRIIDTMGPEKVTIYPNISSVAAAFSRIKTSWNDAQVISLHGRKSQRGLLTALEKYAKVAIYTDSNKNPAWIASWLIKKEILDVDMCILERLGTSQERIRWVEPGQTHKLDVAQPNIVVLMRKPARPEKKTQLFVGMPEKRFAHRDGLITKSEVRAVTLSKLRLSPKLTLWDLGAGSGSVSIEASTIVRKGRVYAVEKRKDRIVQIMVNKKRFGVKNLEVVQADLPEGIKNLPDPDRVFIGGGGDKLETIMAAAAGSLKLGGIMVINTVLIANIDRVMRRLEQLGFKAAIVQIQVSRGKAMPWSTRLEAQSPVWIISGEKI